MGEGIEDFSVVIIGYNEAAVLPRLLGNLKGCHDIIYMDTGSTDGSADVARSLGCNVIEVGDRFREKATEEDRMWWTHRYDWSPSFKVGEGYFHFANARNHAATFAKNDWLFTPDCDEIPIWDLEKVRQAIQDADHLVYPFCYQHQQPDPNNPDWRCGLEFTHSKFYRRSMLHWVKWVHEVLAPLPGKKPRPPKFVDCIYHHHWQNQSTSRGNYLPGLELSIVREPDDPRNSFYLAREYLYAARYDIAVKMFDRAIALATWLPEKAQAFIFQGNCYQWLGNRGKAIECYHRAMQTHDGRRDTFWELAQLYKDNEPQRAIIYLEAAMAIPFKVHGYLNDMRLYGWRIPDLLAQLYSKIGNEEKAKHWWLEVLKHDPPSQLLSNIGWFYRDWLPHVTIVVPMVRPEGMKRLHESLKRNTLYPSWDLIVLDGEDESPVAKFNRGVELARGQLIAYLADDTEVEHGWLTQAVTHFRERFGRKGLVILNDGYWQGRMANHFLVSKNVVELLDDEIWHSGYFQWCVDNELYWRLKKLGLVSFCSEAKIIHHHPDTPTQMKGIRREPDKWDRRKVPYIAKDRRLFYRRQRQLSFGPTVAAFCTMYNEAHHIEEFVRWNLRYVNAIYISDNGSTDGSIEIARKAGAYVISTGIVHNPEHYDESRTKQIALEAAMHDGHDFYLFIEPDERLSLRAGMMLPDLLNDERINAYRMPIPTFWLGRSHYRTDTDFGKFYLTKPYPTKLFRHNSGVRMYEPPPGGHSFPCVNGNPQTPWPAHTVDVDLAVLHYAFDTREIALDKYNRYTKADPNSMMSKSVARYAHLHPDFEGVELKEWKPFEHLKEHDIIFVTGPQRSGTRICAKMIAHDTGMEYVDEIEFGIGYPDKLRALIEQKPKNIVVQCPSLSRWIHEFDGPRTAVVFMMRDLDEIKASEKRIGWDSEEAELEKYDYSHPTQAEAKYAFWNDVQWQAVENPIEIDYRSLAEHPLWIPKEQRKDFGWSQTEPGKMDVPYVDRPNRRKFPDIEHSQETHPERLLALELLGNWNGGLVLDIGCGKHKTHANMVGIDIKPIADIQADAADLSRYSDGTVDAIVARHSFEHFEDPLDVLNEWTRILKSGGRMIFVLPDHERIDTFSPIMNDGSHKHAYTIASFCELVRKVPDLNVEEVGLAIEGWSFYAKMEKV